LIGAATIDRPYGMPIEKGTWEPPVSIELKPKNQSEQAFEYLLSLPDHFPDDPIFIMFMASYDWSMWLQDTPVVKGFEIVRQRSFTPPCKRMMGMVFWKKYAVKVRPFYDFKLSELRWPDDPYGKNHKMILSTKNPTKTRKPSFKLSGVLRLSIHSALHPCRSSKQSGR
jgi:hypothetical protein